VVKAARFHHNYRDPDERVEYKTRSAPPLDEEATRTPEAKTRRRKSPGNTIANFLGQKV
jgi:hypothetical protein